MCNTKASIHLLLLKTSTCESIELLYWFIQIQILVFFIGPLSKPSTFQAWCSGLMWNQKSSNSFEAKGERINPDLSAWPSRNWPALGMRGLLLLLVLFWCPCWAGRCIPRICVGQLQQEQEEQEHLKANAATPIPRRGGSAAGPTSAKRIVGILHYENCRFAHQPAQD